MGRFTPNDKLLLHSRPDRWRCQNGDGMADSEKC